MKQITLIKIAGCPYCAAAFKAIDELKAANSAYAAATIEVVDENFQPERAGKFTDYYYVPTMYVFTRRTPAKVTTNVLPTSVKFSRRRHESGRSSKRRN